MSGYTKGPWKFVIEHGDRKIIAPPKGQYRHETLMCDMQYYPWCPDDDADWKLIASAPDLLEACQLINDLDPWKDSTTEWNDAFKKVSAAIKKATE